MEVDYAKDCWKINGGLWLEWVEGSGIWDAALLSTDYRNEIIIQQQTNKLEENQSISTNIEHWASIQTHRD